MIQTHKTSSSYLSLSSTTLTCSFYLPLLETKELSVSDTVVCCFYCEVSVDADFEKSHYIGIGNNEKPAQVAHIKTFCINDQSGTVVLNLFLSAYHVEVSTAALCHLEVATRMEKDKAPIFTHIFTAVRPTTYLKNLVKIYF